MTRAGKIDLLVPTEDTTGAGDLPPLLHELITSNPGKLTVGKLYGGVLIYEIWKTTRFSNLEILAKMEEEMEEKEALARGETIPSKEKPEEKKEGKEVAGLKGEAEVKKEEEVPAAEDCKMSRENSYDR